jgi:uncharacterized protein YjbI with pentapeptide repeats
MGQKSNLLTLRTNKENIDSRSLNPKEFLNSFEFLNSLKRSLDKKGILVTFSSLNTNANTCYLTLETFYKTHKLAKYRKMLKLHRKNEAMRKNLKRKNLLKKNLIQKNLIKNNLIQNDLIKKNLVKKNLIKKNLKIKNLNKKILKKEDLKKNKLNKRKLNKKNLEIKKLNKKILKKKSLKIKRFKLRTKMITRLFSKMVKHKILVLNISLINIHLNNDLLVEFYFTFKKFQNLLFARRFHLFIDFLKITSLFITKKIHSNTFLIILGTIFKILPKKLHAKFFAFLKILLTFLIEQEDTQIAGVKFTIGGKLKGKLRSSSLRILIGKLSNQSILSEVDFAKVHVHTLYGCFGLKI